MSIKNLIVTVALLGMPGLSAAAGCGDDKRIAFLLREAYYSADRTAAESRLITGIMPVAACLAREGKLPNPAALPGRFGIAVYVWGRLRDQELRMSTPEDLDRQLRLWALGAKKKKEGV